MPAKKRRADQSNVVAASFTAEQLRSLPFDVVVSEIIPLLAQKKELSVDDWAMKLVEWCEPRDHKMFIDLEEYDAIVLFAYTKV